MKFEGNEGLLFNLILRSCAEVGLCIISELLYRYIFLIVIHMAIKIHNLKFEPVTFSYLHLIDPKPSAHEVAKYTLIVVLLLLFQAQE